MTRVLWPGKYEELEDYLRRFSNMGDPHGPYDVVGILHLMLALLDNLRENELPGELEEIFAEGLLDEEQARFLRRLADYTRVTTKPPESGGSHEEP